MIYRLFYISRCTIREDFDAKNIAELIATHAASKNNARGITGAMTFDGNDFSQILEGKKEDVLALFERIKNDHRHDNVEIIKEQDNVVRHYENWAMKVLDSTNYDELVKVMA